MLCELRPKWYITPNSSGSHYVCVCTHHQNVKLLVDATKLTESYKELMEKLVFDQGRILNVCCIDATNVLE